MDRIPHYRADATGNIAGIKADCVVQMKNELATADDFIINVDDTAAHGEYSKYLTDAELRACFKKAQK